MLASRAIMMLQSLIAEHGDIEVMINSSRSGHRDAFVRSIAVMMNGQGASEVADYIIILDWPKAAQPHRIR